MRLVRFLAAGLMLALSYLPAAAADFRSVLPLLIDLSGWQAEKADGMTTDMSGGRSVMAARHYEAGDKSLDVTVMAGGQAQTGGAAAASGEFSMETGDGKVSGRKVNGFYVLSQHTPADKSGSVTVVLADQAVMIAAYSGLSDTEALALLQKFDWGGIKAVVTK